MNWYFPSNNNAEINGISNPGAETFQGTPLKSLAREICQNSLDAALPEKVVKIEFEPFSMSCKEFPDADSLKYAFCSSKEFWNLQENKKTVEFFERAIKMIESNDIPFLRISDFNTSGLLGSKEDYNSPWCNLTKSSGASDKSGTSGGSFGIGKFAPFVCSEFRTVFYSTLDTESITASQGISRITSFRRDDGETTIGVGYYGAPDNKPVNSQIHLDPTFRRQTDQTGTDIYIAGFRFHSTDWKADIIASVLDGFLHAVLKGNLIVHIADVVISKDTLPLLLNEYRTSITENADKYYTVLTSQDTVWYETDYKNHGLIKLGLIIQPEMHRKVAMIRKTGMKIMDRGNVSGVIPFAGVMLIEGNQVNDYLRNLENPQHTKWEPDRIEPKTAIPQAKQYLADLLNYIRDCLEKLKQEDTSDEINPDVGEYLPDEVEDDTSTDSNPKESLLDTIKSYEKTLPPKRLFNNNSSIDEADDIIDEDGTIPIDDRDSGINHIEKEDSGGGGGGSGGDNEGGGDGTNSNERAKALTGVAATKIRVVCLNKDSGEYSITFVPAETADNGVMDLFLSAESQNYGAPILEVVGLSNPTISVENNRITGLTFIKDNPIRIKVVLDFKDYCSMEVKAYGNKA